MNLKIGKRTKNIMILALALLIPVLVLFVFMPSLTGMTGGVTAEEREQLERAIRRAAVACYAAEGFYPPDLEYIVENYGVQIRKDVFIVDYDIFAENIMPGIKVMGK